MLAVRRGTLVAAAPERHGWGVHAHGDHRVLEQDGRISGYAAYAGIALDDELVVIVVSNIQTQAPARIGPELGELVHGKAIAPPPLRPGATGPPALDGAPPLSAFAGSYQVAPGFAMAVATRPEGLTLAGPDGDALVLDRAGPTTFFFRPLYVEVGFAVAGAGPATALLWSGASFQRVE